MADSDDKDVVVRKLPVLKADFQVNFTIWAASPLRPNGVFSLKMCFVSMGSV